MFSVDEALTVCKAWKEALSSLPIPSLLLRGVEEGGALSNWVIQRQPTVVSLELSKCAVRAVAALAAIQGKGLTSLKWSLPDSLHRADALPRSLAALFPNLHNLDVTGSVASTWLCKLGSLQSLKTLSLTIPKLTNAATAGAAVRFPSLPSLRDLHLEPWSGTPELHIQLDDLPALTHLGLWEGTVALQASQPAPQLQRLTMAAEQLAVDFAALPGLKRATFCTSCQIQRPATITAATALTYLNVFGSPCDPSALELLRRLPGSVRSLTLEGMWPQAVAGVVGGMTSLVGLELLPDDGAPLPADGAPVWAGLRALWCVYDPLVDEGGDVPKALRQASKLEVLQISLPRPTIQDVDVLASLPALRKLMLDGLPALTELELLDGSVAVLASEPAPQLQRLANDAGQLAVDFAALPGLKSAKLFTACHLERPASIAAATALTYLELTSEYEWDPSSLELLQSLPPSVRCLSMDKDWPQEAANLVGRMTSLVGLELLQEYASPLPADDAPVWAGLRALQSTQFGEASEGGDVPKGLRRASKLEVLEVFLPHPTLRDVDIITSLPALRKLFIRGRPASHPVGSQLLNVLGRAVPQVEVVLNAADSRDEEFFKLSSLSLRGDEEEKELCNWIVRCQPTVVRLKLSSDDARVVTALAALQRKGLTSLDWTKSLPLHIIDALACPLASFFPSLCELGLSRLNVASTWLWELSSLRRLKTLRLAFHELDDAATAGVVVRFPPLPSLSYLDVTAWPGPPELHLQLEDLPALTQLVLGGSRVAVLASLPSPQLQRLSSYAEHLAVDFAALPCLESATLCTSSQLQAPASIAAATALTYLEVTSEDEWDPSALEMLRSLPPSVSCIGMVDQWPQEAADWVENMTGLVGLELHMAGGGAPWPADDAPVWAGLRAFVGSCLTRDDERGDVPKALRQSSKLEVLQLSLPNPSIQDMDVITSLPALRKLLVYGYEVGDPVATAMLNVCRRAMPQVEVFLDAADCLGAEFFKRECAL
ncbi:hypothetical protein N2152v2_000970 [Parachlorella kessleri]